MFDGSTASLMSATRPIFGWATRETASDGRTATLNESEAVARASMV